ncbi:MAG: BatA domain-containing protein [Bacteroidota bacterium]
MFQLLQPLWLYVLTGISIPVIIHFWNQRPGKILKVGSVSLITDDSKEYKRSLKLSDLLLLLLRCFADCRIGACFIRTNLAAAT